MSKTMHVKGQPCTALHRAFLLAALIVVAVGAGAVRGTAAISASEEQVANLKQKAPKTTPPPSHVTYFAAVISVVSYLVLLLASLQRKRRSTERINKAILASLAWNVAVMDRNGVIIAVNHSWMTFAKENGLSDAATVCPGVSYVDVARAGAAEHAPGAEQALQGIRDVCEGRRGSFRMEYECSSPTQQRWFLMTVTALKRPEGGAVVAHLDITDRKQAELALRDLTAQLMTGQEAERARIARELHDGLNQQLSLLNIEVEQLGKAARNTGAPDLRHATNGLSLRIAEIVNDVHNLSRSLHPWRLETLGLKAAIGGFCSEMTSQHGLPVRFSHSALPPTIAPDVSLSVFRIVQEALHNVVKHSAASEASVDLTTRNNVLHLTVMDSGKGFEINDGLLPSGLGLISMRERARFIGGRFTVTSQPSRGTRIDVLVPLSATETQSNTDTAAADIGGRRETTDHTRRRSPASSGRFRKAARG